MKQAKAADVHVVDEGFLDDVGKSPASVAQLIIQHSIAAWGSDVSFHFVNIYLSVLTVGHLVPVSSTTLFQRHYLKLFSRCIWDFIQFLSINSLHYFRILLKCFIVVNHLPLSFILFFSVYCGLVSDLWWIEKLPLYVCGCLLLVMYLYCFDAVGLASGRALSP